MLTAEQIAAYRDAAAMLVDPVNDYIIRDVARRVAKAGQLTSTAAYQVYRMQLMGKTKKEIMARLKKEMGVSEREAEKLLTQAAETGYRYDIQWLPDARVLPFAQNEPLQQIVSAAVKLAQDDFRNLTQTMGMVSRTGKALPLQEAYLEAVDDVFKRVITGAADYNTATRQAWQTLYDRGLVVIDYESGVHTSLEAAVRRDMMGGLGLMQEQISAELHDQAGADGWEISAHANSAPDHEPIQGKQYSDAEYTALNNSLVRRIGTLNCGHAAFPIILGVSDPVHSPAELEAMRKANEDGVTVNGRHYTGYEATQAQRAREREIRRLRRKVAVDEELAKAAPDGQEKVRAEQTLQQSRIKLKVKEQEYKRFSKAAGLRTQNDRLMTIGYGRGQSGRARATVDKYSTVRYNKDGTVRVTDDWKKYGKLTLPQKYVPNAVVETQTQYRNGTVQIDRTFYGADARISVQIHSGNHNRPKHHKFGLHGEHAHTFEWVDGTAEPNRSSRELNEKERVENADILKGDE